MRGVAPRGEGLCYTVMPPLLPPPQGLQKDRAGGSQVSSGLWGGKKGKLHAGVGEGRRTQSLPREVKVLPEGRGGGLYGFRASRIGLNSSTPYPHFPQARVMATIGVTRGLGDHNLKVCSSTLPIKPFLSCFPEVSTLSLFWGSQAGFHPGSLSPQVSYQANPATQFSLPSFPTRYECTI